MKSILYGAGEEAPSELSIGAWADKTWNQEYEATTDGIVLGRIRYVSSGNPAVVFDFRTDASSPPTTSKGQAGVSAWQSGVSVCFAWPVRKGHNWKIVATGVVTAFVRWMPLS